MNKLCFSCFFLFFIIIIAFKRLTGFEQKTWNLSVLSFSFIFGDAYILNNSFCKVSSAVFFTLVTDNVAFCL